MQYPKCPNCGATMQPRNGIFGPFWSCPNPLCNYTMNPNGTSPNWLQLRQQVLDNAHDMCEKYIGILQSDVTESLGQSFGTTTVEKIMADFFREYDTVRPALVKIFNKPAYAGEKLKALSDIGRVELQAAASMKIIGNRKRALDYAQTAYSHILSTEPASRAAMDLIQELTPKLQTTPSPITNVLPSPTPQPPTPPTTTPLPAPQPKPQPEPSKSATTVKSDEPSGCLIILCLTFAPILFVALFSLVL